jgi:hypothetical protein
MKNILIIGDSFCLHRGEQYPTSWVRLLEQSTRCKVYGVGLDGRGWWQQHRWYKENIKSLPNPADTAVVWVHTSPHRLPCDNDAKVNVTVLDIEDCTAPGQSSPHGKLFNLAREFYSSPLYVEEFYAWAIVAWWKQLAIDLLPYKKVIHLFGFYEHGIADVDRLNLLTTNSVVVNKPPLISLSMAESSLPLRQIRQDPRINHFSNHNNAQLANFLRETLENTPVNTQTEITNLNQWKFEKSVEIPRFESSIFADLKIIRK